MKKGKNQLKKLVGIIGSKYAVYNKLIDISKPTDNLRKIWIIQYLQREWKRARSERLENKIQKIFVLENTMKGQK